MAKAKRRVSSTKARTGSTPEPEPEDFDARKKQPNLKAASERIANRLNLAVRGNEDGYRFDPLTILTILSMLIPLIQQCGFFSKDLRRPSRLTQRRVLNECRAHIEGRDNVELAVDAILDDVSGITNEEVKVYQSEV